MVDALWLIFVASGCLSFVPGPDGRLRCLLLMDATRCFGLQAMAYLRERRPIVNPHEGFVAQLEAFETKLKEERTAAIAGGQAKKVCSPGGQRGGDGGGRLVCCARAIFAVEDRAHDGGPPANVVVVGKGGCGYRGWGGGG